MRYPVMIQKDGNSYTASFPDIPEALTCGDTPEEALSEAAGALLTAFEFYFEDERAIPAPSECDCLQYVDVPLGVWAKVQVLNTMVRESVKQSDLARRMGLRKQDVQRIVDIHHSTKIDTLGAAIAAMGHRLNLSIS